MAVVLALACAIVYGSADFFGGLASRRAATVGVVVVSQAIGSLLLLAALPFLGGHATAADWAWGAACGVAGAGAVALLYRGLAIGTMGIVSPTTAGLAALVPVAYGIMARGEHPSPLAVAGIAAALVAIILVSLAPPTDAATAASKRRGLPPGLAEALGAGILFGCFFIALAQSGPAAGLLPLVSARATSLLLLGLGALVFGRVADLRVGRGALPAIVVCGLLDMGANILFLLAARSGMISVVAVVSSLYPAATVALAGIVLHERLGRTQWTGVGFALAGVIAMSAGR